MLPKGLEFETSGNNAQPNDVLQFKYNMLINALFSRSELGYGNDKLRFNTQDMETLLAYMEPELYQNKLSALLLKDEAE